jgi:F0F1-type ATP synthase assembly protein I
MTTNPGSRPPRGPSPVVAGSLLVATLLLCAGIGFGLGSLVGAPAPLGIAGLFVGFAAGIVVVIKRFPNV